MAENVNTVFSLIIFFICVRDSIEASVIVGILLQSMNRLLPRFKKQVWIGAFSGIFVSVSVGIALVITFYVAKDEAMKEEDKAIFEGVLAWIAAVLMSILAFAMLKMVGMEARIRMKLTKAVQQTIGEANALKAKNEASLEEGLGGSHRMPSAVAEGTEKDTDENAVDVAPPAAVIDNLDEVYEKHKWSIITLAFVSVFREGLEVVLFVFAVGADTPASSIPLAAITGLAGGIFFGFFTYYTGRQLKQLKPFFVCSFIILLFLAAGQVANGQHEFDEAGCFGKNFEMWEEAEEEGEEIEIPWYNFPVWDIGECCSANADKAASSKEGNIFFPMLHAVFGYNHEPTPLWWILYLCYFLVMVVVIIAKVRQGTLFDRDAKYRRMFMDQGIEEPSFEMEELIAEARAADKLKRKNWLRSIVGLKPKAATSKTAEPSVTKLAQM